MSYQAEEFVANLRGCSRGEKSILWVIAHHLDQRTGIARISQDHIALEAEMSERHVRTLTQAMAERGVLAIQRSRDGKGSVAEYRLAGFSCSLKEEAASALAAQERRKSVAPKAEICAAKEELASAPNKEKKNERQRSKTLPYPPLQGGSSYRLSMRNHQRLARCWEKARSRPSDGERQLLWKDLLQVACADLAIGYEDAVHDLLLMDADVWSARLELKKNAVSVIA